MMISGVNSVNSVNNLQNVRKTEGSAKVSSNSDSVTVSKEAKEMSELYFMDRVAAETPDVRADRIAEVKEKIKDPSYLNDALFNSAADKFLSAIGL